MGLNFDFWLNYKWDNWFFGKLRLVLFQNYFYFSIYGIWNEEPNLPIWNGLESDVVKGFLILYAINWAN